MTAPGPETREREKDKLLVTDAELIRILGVPERQARLALRALDDNPRSGFPRKQKLWGDRRSLAAVRAYVERTGGLESGIGAARPQPKAGPRIRLPRRHPAEPLRRGTHHE